MGSEFDVLYDLISIGTKVATGLATAQSLMSYHDPGAYGFIALIKMFWHFRFIAVLFNVNHWTVLYRQTSDFTSIRFSRSFLVTLYNQIPQYDLPANFEAYGYPSSFLVNFWDSLMTICLVLAVMLAVWIFECILGSSKTLKPLLFKARKALQWNFFITLFLTYYNGIVLYTSFEWRTLHLSGARPIISFVLTILFAFFGIVILVFSAIVSLKALKPENQIQEGKSTCVSEDFRSRNPSSEVFYFVVRGLGAMKHFFIPIFILRMVLYYIIIAYLWEHAIVQCSLITGLSVFMFLYYIIVNPFRTRTMQVFYLGQELILTIANICMTILSVKTDQLDSITSDSIRILSAIIIYAYLVFVYLGLIYLFIQVLFSLAHLYKSLRTNSYKQVIPKNSQTQPNNADTSSIHHLNNISYIQQSPMDGPFVPVKNNGQTFRDFDSPSSKPVYNLENIKNPQQYQQEEEFMMPITVPHENRHNQNSEEPIRKPQHNQSPSGTRPVPYEKFPPLSQKKKPSPSKNSHPQNAYFQSDPQERTGTESVELPYQSNLVHLSYGSGKHDQSSTEIIRNGHVSRSQHLNANDISYSETPHKKFSVPRQIVRTSGQHKPQN